MYKENVKPINGENKIQNFIPLRGGRYLYLSDYNQIINSRSLELFSRHQAGRKIKTWDVDIDENTAAKKIRKLPTIAIEMTENCNLRCKYCIFSGHYENWREPTSRQMKFEVARKGLEYIYSFIKDRKARDFSIGFYGGEPLLNFETIKKIVQFSSKLFRNWKLHFTTTTNLTLLNDEILDFLAAHDFSILVSLDGNRENHDSKRVYCNGKGTFSAVYRNLKKMAERYPQFYEKIGFSGVYSPDLSIKKMHEFFSSDDLIKDRRVRYSVVSPCTDSYYQVYKADWGKYRREYEEVVSCILEKVRNKQELTGYETFIFNEFKKLQDKLLVRSETTLPGTCHFDSRLFLDAKGRFHICERINSTFSIGSVDQGFDFPKMAAIAREYTEFTQTNCRNCKIRSLCIRCYALFAGNGKFEIDPEFCKSQQASVTHTLERYIYCKEEGLL